MRITKRSLLVLCIIATFVIGGVAAAAWLASGTGPGQGEATTAEALTVTARSGDADLYPGSTGDLYLTVNNPNPYAVTLTTVSYGAISGGTAVTCVPTSTANIAIAAGAPTTLASVVVPAEGSVDTKIEEALFMPLTAADACQGDIFLVELTVSGESS